jgi:ubiquinone/menaquinone biosynthesis C-methylase UbiE
VAQPATFAHGRNRIAFELMAGHEALGLLDYGCGTGEFALAVASELGIAVHACDIDAELVERLRRDHGASVEFFAISESEPRIPLEDGEVSVLTCCDVLEHMPAQLRIAALREMRRVLSDDGKLIVTVPHKGLLSWLDPENIKFRFSRLHRLVFTLVKGREIYRKRYGGQRFGNFSAGAMRHVHFSQAALAATLATAGFRVEEVRYFRLVYPLAKAALWLCESAARRVRGLDRLTQLCWKVYVWDSDLEPGRAASSIGVRAGKAA